MKIKKCFYSLHILMIGMGIFIIFSGCRKEDEPDKEGVRIDPSVRFNPEVDYGEIKDQDGNIYKTVKIGTQQWMAENLRTIKYRNGNAIPNATDTAEWNNLTKGAYCNYDNSISNVSTYGRLYNWYAVTDTRNICPEDWHVPSEEEWSYLATFLGGDSKAGGKLKEIDTTHWYSPNLGATNETGFTALPGGYRYNDGEFNFIGLYGFWWSCTEGYNEERANSRELDFDYSYFFEFNDPKTAGFSVRCIKD